MSATTAFANIASSIFDLVQFVIRLVFSPAPRLSEADVISELPNHAP